jgi:hypothetical protein
MKAAVVPKESTMKDASSKKASVSESSRLTHTITPEDAAAMTAMRAAVLLLKSKLQGIAAREPFNGIMERVSPPEGVAFHTDTVGGISGLWCKPSDARSGDAILHLHGGWFDGKAFCDDVAIQIWVVRRL